MRRAISSSVACLEEWRAIDIVAPIVHTRTTKATMHAKIKIPRPTHMSIGEDMTAKEEPWTNADAV